MERTITLSEVEHLFDFLAQKRVRHYDLQVELLDHLASSIEEKWQTEPTLSFELALQEEYKKFGVTGFSKLVKKRERYISKQLHKQLHRQVLGWISSSRVLFVIPMILGMGHMLQFFPFAEIAAVIFVGIGFLLLIYGLIQHKKFIRKQRKKFYFLDAQVSLLVMCMNLYFLPIHFSNIMDYDLQYLPFWVAQVFAILWVYGMIFCYELVFVQLKAKRQEAIQIMAIEEVAMS